MSSTSPRIFLPDLRELEKSLPVPIPDRVRILSELEFDLEELWGRLLAQGLEAEEAKARALEALAPDPGTIRQLGWLHAPIYRRVTLNMRDDRLRIVERSALAAATGGILLLQTLTLLRADLLRNPSPFLFPVLGLGALLVACVLAKVFELWIKGDHRNARGGLGLILGLSGIVLGAAFGGTLVDLVRLAGILERAPEMAGRVIPLWMVRESTLLSVAILLALFGGLVWFVLTQWLTLVASARQEVLGLGRDSGN